ncbi:MAG: UbiA family prenyltransferase [Candidatus Omnitrophica bacterium]|nr:UbiA family prenyltransferase [Candidatus Omnitrophota bacterium]
MSAAAKTRIFLEMIKFEHTLFALPFAYLGLWLAEGGWPRPRIFLWVTVAMAGMRTSAMALNRVIDAEIDSLNPRTRDRALPRGTLTRASVWGAAVISCAVYVVAAAMLNGTCLVLSPIPVVLAVLYPYLKKFTWLCHFFLGATLGIAPAAGWIAATGALAPECWLLFFAVFFWVSGFDIIYSLQDEDFDRTHGLQSVPARFDAGFSLGLVRVLHSLTLAFLIGLGLYGGRGALYWAGLAWIGFLLFREHWLVRRFGMKKIQQAFFHTNALVSLSLFGATFLDLMR